MLDPLRSLFESGERVFSCEVDSSRAVKQSNLQRSVTEERNRYDDFRFERSELLAIFSFLLRIPFHPLLLAKYANPIIVTLR